MQKTQKLRYILFGALISLFLSTAVVPALAGSTSKQLMAYYNNIKIVLDGAVLTPKDGSGKVVEPFTVDGTTYLPVRALCEAIGKDVTWDAATQTVYVGKEDQTKPDTYLDRIQYNDYKTAWPTNTYYKINGTITDLTNTTYSNGILFSIETYDAVKDDNDKASTIVDYPLNGQYKTLNGKVVVPTATNIAGLKETSCNGADIAANVYFYADGRLIYTAKNVTPTMPFTYSLDLTGVNMLTVKMSWNNNSLYTAYIALTDCALYK